MYRSQSPSLTLFLFQLLFFHGDLIPSPVNPHKSLSGPDLLPESSTPGEAGVYLIPPPWGAGFQGDMLSLRHLCHQGVILWAMRSLRPELRGLEGESEEQ